MSCSSVVTILSKATCKVIKLLVNADMAQLEC